MTGDDDKPRINLRYPLYQLGKALSGAGGRAAERVRQWQQVLRGILDGTLRIGSRTPIAQTPIWVTPEVVHGGFATGRFAAGGPLQPHELAKLASLGPLPDAGERTALNRHFVSEAGRAELEAMLADGRFRVRVPEEGALLIEAWLLRRGEKRRAGRLLEPITPFFDRLRFYPVPHPRPLRSGEGVFVQTAGDSVKLLRNRRPRRSVERMNESLRVWAPLYDRAVALFLETVDGEVPAFRRSGAGERVRAQNGQPVVAGGWPCRRYPAGWRARAQDLLDEYRAARAQSELCRKPEKPKENFARLRGHLERCIQDPASLAGRDVGMIRKVLASFVTRHGAPGSSQLQKTRTEQARTAARPAHAALAHLVADRLEHYPQDEGVPELESALAPVSAEEASRLRLPAGEPLPESVVFTARRCLEAPIGALAEKQLIPSGEEMAKLLPPLTCRARAAEIRDPELRRVYAAVYLAFRRRRSLLLLDLESQAKIREMPWIAQIEPWVVPNQASRDAAREALKQASALALGTFPQVILPNKLLKELRALGAAAGLSLPFVDELASDIFMGDFAPPFLRAAKVAAHLLKGTLYERYYGLPFDRVLALESPGFVALCNELAGVKDDDARSVARNGTILEQAQILTTHNLAVLFEELGLARSLPLGELARRVFTWVCRRQQPNIADWRPQLHMMKNTAYAWRQMIFFLSLLDRAEVDAFVTWSAAHLERRRADFRARFEPVFAGLRAAAAGERFGPDGLHAPSGGRRFLGWSAGPHWLLPRAGSQ